MSADVLELLGADPAWSGAVERLSSLYESKGAEASQHAAAIADRYRGRRAAMVFDVVASRQRRYHAVVRSKIEQFKNTPAAASLAALAELGVTGLGLRTSEPDTMRNVAAGLLRYGEHHRLPTDDTACEAWARAAATVELAPKLDPYVGSVSGIGPALFNYLRMLCGADALKPDSRVRKAIRALGFNPPGGEAELLVVAGALAEELGTSRPILDQLLWHFAE